MLRPKKHSCKEFDNEKKFLRLENSSPPHNFSNGPSLISLLLRAELSHQIVVCNDHVYIHLVPFNKIVLTPNNKGALMSLSISQI